MECDETSPDALSPELITALSGPASSCASSGPLVPAETRLVKPGSEPFLKQLQRPPHLPFSFYVTFIVLLDINGPERKIKCAFGCLNPIIKLCMASSLPLSQSCRRKIINTMNDGHDSDRCVRAATFDHQHHLAAFCCTCPALCCVCLSPSDL